MPYGLPILILFIQGIEVLFTNTTEKPNKEETHKSFWYFVIFLYAKPLFDRLKRCSQTHDHLLLCMQVRQPLQLSEKKTTSINTWVWNSTVN